MGRYKVVTYPIIGNDPYFKTDTDNLKEAKESFETAAYWDYTAVLYDSVDDKWIGQSHSSMDSEAISNCVAGLTGAGAAAVQVFLSAGTSTPVAFGTASAVYGAVKSRMGTGNALTKAMTLALTSKKKS